MYEATAGAKVPLLVSPRYGLQRSAPFVGRSKSRFFERGHVSHVLSARGRRSGRGRCASYGFSEPGMRGGIPKGFRPKAQGCEERATLGVRWRRRFTPERVAALPCRVSNTKCEAATLSGLSHFLGLFPRVARSLQPWAGGLNPFGIGNACQVQRGLAHSGFVGYPAAASV